MASGLPISSLFYIRLGSQSTHHILELKGVKTHSGLSHSPGSSHCKTEITFNVFMYTISHFRFPSCLCFEGEFPSINPYLEKMPPKAATPSPSPWLPHWVWKPWCLDTVSAEVDWTWEAGSSVFSGNCQEFSCHNSLVVIKSNYMFQMMKSTVMKRWPSSQRDRCIKPRGF